MRELWNHQRRGIDETLAAIARGERRILVTSPTGGGKTAMMQSLAAEYIEQGRKVILYTNRKLLVEQTSRVLQTAGIDHGIRAAGYEHEADLLFQVSSIQTENARVLKGKQWALWDAELALVDEAHLQTAKTAQTLLAAHHEMGAAYVGFTATPLGLSSLYETLIQAGTVSELRKCGALVPCHHYGPDEPDLKEIKKVALGEDLTENQAKKVMGAAGSVQIQQLFGRVLEWFDRLNSERKPSILFACGVDESVWFCEAFNAAGIPAAHIDGEAVLWPDGSFERTSREARDRVLEDSRNGKITVLCNRFVLREGIDAPWLAHGIFATVFGSLQSYLQSGGRLLRAHPSLSEVTLQDHGGNWWRHGSLNVDREWFLDLTNGIASGLREERMRAKKEPEPARCPKCAKIMHGPRCLCGFEFGLSKRSRPVFQTDGTLREMVGDIFKPHRLSKNPQGPDIWRKMYYRSKTAKGERTFRAAAALFAMENNWGYPDPSWPLMPTVEIDWHRKVSEVPMERLTR